MTAPASPLGPGSGSLQACFLTILPRIERHGRCYFRHIKCPHQREELLAEVRGLAWQWFVRLAGRGRDVTSFVSALASYAARAANSGRRVCGHERSKDVLSPVARRRHGFAVGTLPDHGTLGGNPLEEALRDNTRSPVDEQVCFRLDFPAWRASRTERDRRVLDDLMLGERTLEVAGRHGLSPGRVSQLRREFHRDWQRFHGPPAPAAV